MIGQRLAGAALLVVVAGVVVSAQVSARNVQAIEKNGSPARADLLIREFVFPAENDKAVRVRVGNSGSAASALCILRLTVREINGVPVGRVVEIKLPPLAAGRNKWVLINAKGILPTNVSLESTTFKLNADATSLVAESDEANNEEWHRL